jgi:hypothetical protein
VAGQARTGEFPSMHVCGLLAWWVHNFMQRPAESEKGSVTRWEVTHSQGTPSLETVLWPHTVDGRRFPVAVTGDQGEPGSILI